jgi:hypothetical protein
LRDRAAWRGTHRRGADGGDAQTESVTEEGLRWWETGEVDAWAVGDECVVLRRGRARRTVRGGEKNSVGGQWLCFKGERRGRGPDRWARWRQCNGTVSGGSSPAVACASGVVAVLQRRAAGSRSRRDGGPGRQQLGAARSSAVRRSAWR